MSRRLRPILAAGLGLLWPLWVAAQVAHQRHPPGSTNEYIRSLEDPGREEWQKPAEVLARLALKPGDSIADIGAGSGYFALRFAAAVGPTGKVYAVDIDREMLAYIEARAKNEQLSNIQRVLADPHDPKLPPSSVGMIFICDTLHHISQREQYYPLLLRALKPGGRLVNIDFQKKPEITLGPPLAMRIDRQDMIKEAEAGGFHLVQEYNFLPYQYFLVFQP
jgi:ubiquinone/menaquinone biosynthesis C-methylase UbiE